MIKSINFGSSYKSYNFSSTGSSAEKPAVLKNDLTDNVSKNQKKVKYGVSAAAILGVASALTMIARRQKFSLNLKNIAKTNPKDWAVFSISTKKNPKKTLEIKGREVLELGAGSVAGGLLGGAVFDEKKHLKAKAREALNQFVGVISVPLGFVWAGSELTNKFVDLSVKNPNTKHTKLLNYSKKLNSMQNGPNVFKAFAVVAALIPGIIAGNKVSNFINEKLYKKEVDRGIKGTDFAPHIDDLGVGVVLMYGKDNPVAGGLSRIIPLALVVPGIETGTAKDGQYDKKN